MKRIWMVAAAMVAAAAACSGGQDKLSVVLIDSAGTPREVLLSATEKARQALRTAGLESEWILCSDCALPPAVTRVLVQIVPTRHGVAPEESGELGRAAWCPAAERCTTAWVFYGPIQEFAGDTAQPVGSILGYAMAHEIGHLMGLGHDTSGIMKAGLNKRDPLDASRLRFPAYDAKKIRATVAIWTAQTAASGAAEGM